MPATLPYVGLGTAGGGASASSVGNTVAAAIARGVQHVDCAPLYGNQAEIGTRAFAGLSPSRRAAVWVTSKLWLTNFGKVHVRPACEHTLRELQLDYLDLYLMHAQVALAHTGIPPATNTPKDVAGNALTSGVPNAETWHELEELHSCGLCRHIGVSNFSLGDLDALLLCTQVRVRPLCNQVELHPWHQQPQLVEGCLARGVRPVAFSPLGKAEVLSDPTLTAIAHARGVTPAQVALVWNLQRGVTVIPHTTSMHELAQNAAVTPAGDSNALGLTLSLDEMHRISLLDRGRRFLILEWGNASPGSLLQPLAKL
jgi:alcohol dehydrogenase (NADP+)|eukprot:SAG25_NODE_456_length_7858_cov_3.295657_2_plen_313_part_00